MTRLLLIAAALFALLAAYLYLLRLLPVRVERDPFDEAWGDV